ncbi:MAG: hypothetical protein ACRD2U_10095 [Terriglobales bacterium]
MIAKLFDSIFGCSHSHYSFPRSTAKRPGARRTGAASLTGTYVVCLDCGKEMPYDWEAMKVVGSAAESRKYLHGLATKEAS